jgi:MFS family permease
VNQTPELVHERRWAILGVLCLSLFLVVVDNTITNVALPTLSRQLGASTSQLQWIVDAYSLVFAGLLLAGGSLGDRFGRKGALQVGLVAFAACSALAAVSGTANQLIAARALMGIGASLVFPATLAILTNVFTDPVERAKAIGIWAAVSGLAVALGPVTGGWLLEHFWWGSVFLVNLPVVALALVLGQRLLPTSKDPAAGRFDPIGLATSIVAVVALVYTVIEAPQHGWTSAPTIAGFALAAAVLAAFVGWERRRSDPMLDVRIFANPRFTAASLTVAIAFFALFGFIFIITQYFQVVRGYSTLSAGVHTLPFAVGAGVAAPIAAQLALRIGTKLVVAAGLASMAVGFDPRRLDPVLGAGGRLDGAHRRRLDPDDGSRHRSDHGSAAAREGRRRLGRERHHQGARRDLGRRRRRFRVQLVLRPQAGRAPVRAPDPRAGPRCRHRLGDRGAGGRASSARAGPRDHRVRRSHGVPRRHGQRHSGGRRRRRCRHGPRPRLPPVAGVEHHLGRRGPGHHRRHRHRR